MTYKRDHSIVRQWTTKAGLPAVVVRVDRTPHIAVYFNGYVAVPKGHPLYRKDCDNAGNFDVHGGLTYSSFDTEWGTGWWFGFDTCHIHADATTQNEHFVAAECESLATQIFAAHPPKGL